MRKDDANKSSTRHVAMDDATAERLKYIGGTLKRGVYLASFSADVSALLAAEQKFRSPPALSPTVAKPPTATQLATQAARIARDPIKETINSDLAYYRANGYPTLVASDLSWELIARMDQEIADGVAPEQRAITSERLVALWEDEE